MKRFCGTVVCAVVGAALLAGLGGCEQLNPRPPVDLATPIYAPPPVVAVQPRPSNGSIYQAAQYRPLFEDYRARLVGDSLTVQIVEKISATQRSTSSIDKNGKLAAGITAFPCFKANSFARASAAGPLTLELPSRGTISVDEPRSSHEVLRGVAGAGSHGSARPGEHRGRADRPGGEGLDRNPLPLRPPERNEH